MANFMGTAASDTIDGTFRADRLAGGDGADTINGQGGDDTLVGDAGADVLRGGLGNDVYITETGDTLVEEAGAGIDLVESSSNIFLGENFENARLVGGDDVYIVGNGLGNTLTGNTGNNVLNGLEGLDVVDYSAATASLTVSLDASGGQAIPGLGTDQFESIEGLIGSAFDDILTGNYEDNVLDGGSGHDTLSGGVGDDIYVVDSAADVVVEGAAEGMDLVRVIAGNFRLSANVENAEILATGAANVTGNVMDNVVVAGLGDNDLRGGGGNDTLSYASHTAISGVRVSLAVTVRQGTGGSGVDYISGFENLIGSRFRDALDGSQGANFLTGLKGNDTLSGAGGSDTLVGGVGADMLRGGAGEDVFRYLDARDSGVGRSDSIRDFVRGQDAIDLSRVDANTQAGGYQHFSFIGSVGFSGDATGQLRFEYDAAHDVGRLMGSTDADANAEIVILLVGISTFSAGDVVH